MRRSYSSLAIDHRLYCFNSIVYTHLKKTLKSSTLFRYLLFLAGCLLTAAVLALVALALVTSITVSGGLYLLGGFLIGVGLILVPWRDRLSSGVAISGLLIIFAVMGIRLSQTRIQDSKLKVIVLPSANETRRINMLIDERDALLFGEGMLHLIGGVSSREHENIVPAVSTAYREARAVNGVFASPILSTYLGLQDSTAFDTVVIEPTGGNPVTVGIIFLHGFTGNVSIQCWEIARAVARIGAVTLCPSTGWRGYWWQPEGEAIVQTTVNYLRERGVQHIYLGGFSNGGNGVGSLIPALAAIQDLKGLFFIAGAGNAAGVRETGLPVLVIQGTNDERIPVEAARLFVGEVGEQVTYVELEADHFLITKQPLQVQDALGSWLQDQEPKD